MLPWFTKYPNQNDEILNLDWVIRQVENLKAAYEAFLAANSLTFADPIVWDITKQYSKNTIVLSPEGDAYLSKKVVGAGIQLNNTDYWLEIFNFAEYVRTANSNLTMHIEQNTTRATAAYAVDDWLLWEDVLYKVTAAIAADDLLTIGTNIVHFTVEDFCRAWQTYMVNTIAQYKTDIDASELAYKQQLDQTVLQYKNDVDASELAYKNELDASVAATTQSLQDQLNAAIAGVTVDSEVINARVGYDGTTYSTLGDAIRTQVGYAMQCLPDWTKLDYMGIPPMGNLITPSVPHGVGLYYVSDGNIVFANTGSYVNYRYAIVDVEAGWDVFIGPNVSYEISWYIIVNSSGTIIESGQYLHDHKVMPAGAAKFYVSYHKDYNLGLSLFDRLTTTANTYELKDSSPVYIYDKELRDRIYSVASKAASGNLNSGDVLTVNRTNLKKNQNYTFSGLITSFDKLLIGNGDRVHFGNSWIEITTSNLISHNYTDSDATHSYNHGLTIAEFIKVQIIVPKIPDDTALVRIITKSGTFDQEVEWLGYGYGHYFARSDGSVLTGCTFRWTSGDFRNKVWVFGDSYVSIDPARWVYYLIEDNYIDDVLINGYSGETSPVGYDAFSNGLTYYGKPKYALWTYGMNDGGDTGGVPNSDWLKNVNKFIKACILNRITPILATVPSVPSADHSYKNAWVAASGYRYVDFAAAVGAQADGTWYDGMLSGDDVHPTVKGAKALYQQALYDFPEISCK